MCGYLIRFLLHDGCETTMKYIGIDLIYYTIEYLINDINLSLK
jgi:hypothetical protein